MDSRSNSGCLSKCSLPKTLASASSRSNNTDRARRPSSGNEPGHCVGWLGPLLLGDRDRLDHDVLYRAIAVIGLYSLHRVDDFEALDHFAEQRILRWQPRTL